MPPHWVPVLLGFWMLSAPASLQWCYASWLRLTYLFLCLPPTLTTQSTGHSRLCRSPPDASSVCRIISPLISDGSVQCPIPTHTHPIPVGSWISVSHFVVNGTQVQSQRITVPAQKSPLTGCVIGKIWNPLHLSEPHFSHSFSNCIYRGSTRYQKCKV